MSNSRRWRKFITWWNDMHPQFYAQKGNRHLMTCIDHTINEIKRGDKEDIQCPFEIDCSSCSSLIDTAERSECVQGYDRKPEPNWEAKHTRLVEKVKDIGEIGKIVHKVCRNKHWACDSWGEEELATKISQDLLGDI